MSGSFVYTIDGKVKFWETVRCFYEDHSASTQPPRRLPRAGGRAADEPFAAACGVAPGTRGRRPRRLRSITATHGSAMTRSTTSTLTPGTAAAPSSGGCRVLYKASSSDSIQLLKDTLTGETGHYLVAHSTPARRTALPPLHDADGNSVMTFPLRRERHPLGRAAHPERCRRRLGFRERHHRRHSGTTSPQAPSFPYPKQRPAVSWWTRAASASSSNCYDLPEALLRLRRPRPAAPPVCPHHRPGGAMCLCRRTAAQPAPLASYRGGFADWLDLSWFRGSDWGIAREALY